MKLTTGLVVLVLLFGIGYIVTHSTQPASATVAPVAVAQLHSPDEAGEMIAACGAPRGDAENIAPALGAGIAMRTMTYPRAEFQFTKDERRGNDWTMTGAFAAGRDDTLLRKQAERLMPCLSKVNFSNEFFQEE